LFSLAKLFLVKSVYLYVGPSVLFVCVSCLSYCLILFTSAS